TITLWSLEQERPLVSLFVSGSDWIAWTEEGYYACSPAGERLMGWKVNQGARKAPRYFPAAHFRRSLFHPDVVRQAVALGSVKAALAATGKGRPGGGAVSVAAVMPPEVAITAPAEETEYKGGELVVSAEAKSVGGNKVTAMRLLVDGRPWKGAMGLRPVKGAKSGKVKATWKIDLPPGPHTLAVQAETEVSRSVTAPVQVVNTAPPDTTPPNLYILAVGVSDYPDAQMRLNYAASDAVALSKAFHAKHNGAFGKVEVNLMTDADATRARVSAGLEWMKEKMTDRDVGIVFLSGHGTRDKKGGFHFVPSDIDPRDVEGTCVPGEAVKHLMGNLPGRLIFMLDACHSGAAAEKAGAAGAADDLARDLVTEEYGVLVMSSSMGDEYSLEAGGSIKAGFFTKALTDGLAGEADLNKDGIIHLHELDIYTTVMVQRMTRGEQNPVTGRPPSFQTFPVAKK
ncbi:MAG: caspase family protein, partial [Gemmataceae bacterium]|nr:caspase family protein [Gemmataceae bacterium]